MQQCVTASPGGGRDRWCLKIVFATHQHLHIQLWCRESFIEAIEMICVFPWGTVCSTVSQNHAIDMVQYKDFSVKNSMGRSESAYFFSVIFIVLKIMLGRHGLLKQWIISDAEHSPDDYILSAVWELHGGRSISWVHIHIQVFMYWHEDDWIL